MGSDVVGEPVGLDVGLDADGLAVGGVTIGFVLG